MFLNGTSHEEGGDVGIVECRKDLIPSMSLMKHVN